MGLEDIAMMAAQPNVVVLYPSDAVSCHRLVSAAARHPGMVYLRTTRGKTPVLYDAGEEFLLGGSKILRQSPHDRATLVAAGITVFEALKAQEALEERGISVRVVDLYSIAPIDEPTLVQCVRETDGKVFTVEDHYAHGGLGDAVSSALAGERVRVHKLAVTEVPHSGPPATLLERYGIGHEAIVRAVVAHLDAVVPS
jgi:transketolase